jgi:nucleotide-binding universal stress UspA family protein
MYERILLAVDARRVAASAVLVVAELAQGSGAEVLVVHVRDIERGLRTRYEADQLVERTVARLRSAGVKARGEVRTISDGHVAEALLESAGRFGADLVALGSHGRSELGGLLLGSVGQRVAKGTAAAVMLVSGEEGRRTRRWPARIVTVLLAVDRSERAEAAIETALGLCRQHGATASVLYVEPVLESPDSARRYVRAIVERFRHAGVAARAEGPGGVASVAIQIAEAAERRDADIVVIGSARRGELAAIVMGSVARELVRVTTRPVLLAAKGVVSGREEATPQV